MSIDYYWRKFLRTAGIRNDYEKFVSLMIDGKYLFGSEIYDQVCDSTLEDETEVKLAVLSANTNLERIEIVYKYFNTKKFLEALHSYEEVLTKNEEIAAQLKKKGDYLNRESESSMRMAGHCYNLALSYVPGPGALLGEIYTERSHTEILSNDWRGSLRDTKLAEQYPCTWDKFCARIASSEPIDDLLADIQKIEAEDEADGLSSEEEEKLDYLNDVVFEVHGKHSKILKSASKCVVLKSDKGKGRGLFAKKNITTGSTLIIEKPYVAVLDQILIWDMAHCSKCFKKIKAVFPCNSCVFASYCSEKCRIGDFDAGHRYECRCMPFLHTVRADQYVHLCLKAICRAGPRVLFDIFKNGEPEPGKDGVEDVEGINPRTGVYASNDYYAINHLKSHIAEVSEVELMSYIWLSISIAAILDHETDFVHSLIVSGDERKAFVKFLASKTLQHCLTFPYNAVGLSERRTSDGDGNVEHVIKRGDERQIITGIYPLISMLNHSCDPNVFWVNKPNGEIAILTNRELMEGEELEFSYGCDFATNEYSVRSEDLLKRYHFSCTCFACTLDWPLYKNMSLSNQWFCTFCQEYMRYSRMELIQKCVLETSDESAQLLKCNNCGDMDPLLTFLVWAQYFNRKLSLADRYILSNDPIPAIPLIIDAIQFYQQYISPPAVKVIQAQEMLRDAHDLLIDNYVKCQSPNTN